MYYSLNKTFFCHIYNIYPLEKGKVKEWHKVPDLWTKMMNSTKANNIFLGYFVPFVWGFVLMNVGLGKNPASEIKIGIILDLQTQFSKICLTSINMSLSDFYEDHSNYTTRLAIHVRDSMEDAVQASAAGWVLLSFSLVLLLRCCCSMKR